MEIKLKRLLVSITLLILCSCSGVTITEEGKKVRLYQDNWKNCEFMTNEQINDASFGAHPGICARRAKDRMINKVAEMGGNAYKIVSRSVFPCLMGGTTLIFEVYNCPDQNKSVQ